MSSLATSKPTSARGAAVSRRSLGELQPGCLAWHLNLCSKPIAGAHVPQMLNVRFIPRPWQVT